MTILKTKALTPHVQGQMRDVSNENFTFICWETQIGHQYEGLQQRQLLLIAVSFFDYSRL